MKGYFGGFFFVMPRVVLHLSFINFNSISLEWSIGLVGKPAHLLLVVVRKS